MSCIDEFQILSPIDGRYKKYVYQLSKYLSEYAIVSNRIYVEIEWLKYLVKLGITPVKCLSNDAIKFLDNLKDLNEQDLIEIRKMENIFYHDVKASESFIKRRIEECEIDDLRLLKDWVHIFLTSEDINSTAYGCSIRDAMNNVVKPLMLNLIEMLAKFSIDNADKPLLSRTHGQPATPTTFGKEIAVFVNRLSIQYIKYISKIEYYAKFGGTVGNFNAHVVAFPELNWINITEDFIKSLNLTYQHYSTQIESHDYISELSDSIARFNTILKDLCVDMWLYISNGLISLSNIKGEVGSSTMPHKINPIDFENAEGNIGIANALLGFFSTKLPMSRMQRDLSDSTVLRNIVVALAHSILSYQYVMKSFDRITFDDVKSIQELENNWIILSEPTQIVLKILGKENAFEKVLEFTRGYSITKEQMTNFIKDNCESYRDINNLKVTNYIGIADVLAKNIDNFTPKV